MRLWSGGDSFAVMGSCGGGAVLEAPFDSGGGMVVTAPLVGGDGGGDHIADWSLASPDRLPLRRSSML
jgi:hypothetical protein